MTEIRVEKLSTDEIDQAEVRERWEILAEEHQNTNQFDNYSSTLYKDPETGRIYYYEDQINEYSLWEVEEDDLLGNTKKDYEAFVSEQVSEWISNSDDPIMESIAWGHRDPDSIKADPEYTGECKVLVIGNYYGYQPIQWARDESGWEEITFDSAAQAQEWIDEEEDGIYYLSHNEAGRPDYYIIEA
ncbi:hypothetical protein [Sediminispirochaeta smaragdinae]|uniref:Uncharacterized protein n=1 Tax=Sediminispirochaeta smaragdinae (strain DSM 11293 / JCM 15392 / SEBR 4228) TaxID=573413 RepID=E1R3G2_SEDSS|nr:hypothetical protein [Sediminispirochaeta smaragdinae]ADK81593.1 hypothetical protein Spirs_2480 [Sediminispirochaeta smaragdinae DSM 11293]